MLRNAFTEEAVFSAALPGEGAAAESGAFTGGSAVDSVDDAVRSKRVLLLSAVRKLRLFRKLETKSQTGAAGEGPLLGSPLGAPDFNFAREATPSTAAARLRSKRPAAFGSASGCAGDLSSTGGVVTVPVPGGAASSLGAAESSAGSAGEPPEDPTLVIVSRAAA